MSPDVKRSSLRDAVLNGNSVHFLRKAFLVPIAHKSNFNLKLSKTSAVFDGHYLAEKSSFIKSSAGQITPQCKCCNTFYKWNSFFYIQNVFIFINQPLFRCLLKPL